jgi:hypothetical protein
MTGWRVISREADMAGITWWTVDRASALKALLDSGLSHGDAAAVLTRRFGRLITRGAAADAARRRGWRSLARGGRPPAAGLDL